MDINKIESDKMEIIEVPYNFKEEIETLARIDSVRIGEKPIELTVDIASDIPYELIGDKGHIKEIVNNLLSNAIKYTDKGKIEQVIYNLIDNAIKFSFNDSEIIIRLYNNRGKLFCVVKDNGIGISHDNINKIWQRFYKTDSSRGMDKTGSGIGLSIVKEIISAHNETIDVISTEGVGTEFIFSLSLAKK